MKIIFRRNYPPPFNFLGSVIKNSKNYQNELPPPSHLPHGYDFVDWFLNRNTCTYRENMKTLKDKNFSLLKYSTVFSKVAYTKRQN